MGPVSPRPRPLRLSSCRAGPSLSRSQVLSCGDMEYRGIQYQIVQTASPTGWRWTVELAPPLRSRTGQTIDRAEAVRKALAAIDNLVPPVGKI